MESTFLSIKFLTFIALLLMVVTMLDAVLVAGVYRVVRNKVREARCRAGIAVESREDSTAVDPRHP